MASRDAAERREIAALGGLARAAKETPADMLSRANNAYRDSFRTGHTCTICPEILIPQDLAPEEIGRRADLLYRAHMRRLRLRQQRARRKAADAASEEAAAAAELASLASAQ
jgi:hypothetical protein